MSCGPDLKPCEFLQQFVLFFDYFSPLWVGFSRGILSLACHKWLACPREKQRGTEGGTTGTRPKKKFVFLVLLLIGKLQFWSLAYVKQSTIQLACGGTEKKGWRGYGTPPVIGYQEQAIWHHWVSTVNKEGNAWKVLCAARHHHDNTTDTCYHPKPPPQQTFHSLQSCCLSYFNQKTDK